MMHSSKDYLIKNFFRGTGSYSRCFLKPFRPPVRQWMGFLLATLFFVFQANPIYAFDVDAGNDTTVCQGSSVMLGANPVASNGQAPYTYSWVSDVGNFSSSDPNPIVGPDTTTVYTLFVKDDGGFECDDAITVTVIRVDSMTVLDFAYPSNKAVGPMDTEFFMCENLVGTAQIQIKVKGSPSTPAAGSRIYWTVEGSNANPTTGNFGGADPLVLLTPTGTPANRMFTVQAGCDVNENSMLDPMEMNHLMDVYVVKLDTIKVADKKEPANKATNEPDTVLVVGVDSAGKAMVNLDAVILPGIPKAKEIVLWKVEGMSSSPDKGSFGGTLPKVLTLTASGTPKNFVFTIKAGCDANADSVLQDTEVSREIKVKLIQLDLTIDGVQDPDEFKKGGVLCINNDNDDIAAPNYQQDRYHNPVAGENDLKKLILTAELTGITTGELRFEISAGTTGNNANDTRIKVWDSPTKGAILLDGANKVKNWTVAQWNALPKPVQFYAEGYQRSGAVKDIELKFGYRENAADPNAKYEDTTKVTVVALNLDVDKDNAITNDVKFYKPGYDGFAGAAEGNPVITAANNWRQGMQLITSPLTLGGGNSDVATTVTFKLTDVSQYRGVAMNTGAQSETDYSFEGASSTTSTDVSAAAAGLVKTDLFCKDYGARAKAVAEVKRGSVVLATCELWIPYDTDQDKLPDWFEQQYLNDPVRAAVAGAGTFQVFDTINPMTRAVGAAGGLPAVAAMNAGLWDEEGQNPIATGLPANGVTGDGVNALEEYRGFFYGDHANANHRHHRNSPHHKDVFGWSDVNDVNAGMTDIGLGYLYDPATGNSGIQNGAGTLVRVHRINNNEWNGSPSREINFNRDGLAGATLQRGMLITDVLLPGFGDLGVTRGGMNTGPNGVCNTAVPNAGNAATRLDFQVIPQNQGLANQPALGPGPNGILDPVIVAGDRIDFSTNPPRIVSNTPDGKLHTLTLPTGANAMGYAADDRIRGRIEGVGGTLTHATVTAINANDILKGTISEGTDSKMEKGTVTSGGNNDNHALLRIEKGPNGTLDTPKHPNDVLDGTTGNILPGGDNILNSAANLAGDDVIRGTIQEGTDNKLDSRPATANDLVNGTIQEGANNILDSRPAGGSTDFVIGHVEDGGNGYLDPTTNNAGANIAGSAPAVAAPNDDVYDPATRRIMTGPDGVRNTNPRAGADDEQVISTAGNGTPFAYCVDPDDRDGVDEPAVDDRVNVAAAGDDVAANSNDAGDSNSDPNDVVYAYVHVPGFNTVLNPIVITAAGNPAFGHTTPIDARTGMGAPQDMNRQIFLKRTTGHELGHYQHMAHYNQTTAAVPMPPNPDVIRITPPAGHTANGSLMVQTGTTAWPVSQQMDNADAAQIRLHQKH